jgi:hypothetical protein
VRRSPLEGGGDPRARRNPLEGVPCWAALVGCGAIAAWAVLCAYVSCYVCVLCFFAGFKQDPPRFFRGPSWLSPTQASPMEILRKQERKMGKQMN